MIGLRGNSPAENEELPVGVPPGYEDTDDIRLGDLMRGERATMGKSLLDVQRELRIRASFVAAIENCDVTAFDAPSFIPGYVRSYARYLAMDPDWTFQRFCTESGFRPPHGLAAAASGPKPQRRPSDPAEALANPHALFLPQQPSFWSSVEPRAVGSVLVMALLVCGLGYGGWAVLQEVQKVNLTPGEHAPGVVANLDPVQDASLPEAFDSAQVNLPQPEGLDRIYRPQVLEVPVLTARDGPIAAIDPGLTSSSSQSVLAASGTGTSAQPSTDAAVAEGTGAIFPMAPGGATLAMGPNQSGDGTAPVRTVAPDAPEIELLAARAAWVRVTSAEGTVLLEKTMNAGERFALPKLEAPPVLRAGNSGAVYFAVNGQTYGPAAPGSQVVKNVELSAGALTQKFAFADISKDPELAEMVALASAGPPASDTADVAATSLPE
ncbi:RodZ domain-containing protein [Paracoccus sp. (in: a-proteobacteria)]|uniref:helix-turn-helix domain-containing protein n=1 Tax=Paracoccus sp. TaxID=267 RepID=UPI002899FDFF|nr:RodZ domain-containing protein [Paracoccus sp. (in: a-proteobacteria)]